MFNLKDLGDMGKLASQAKELQRDKDRKHEEQISHLRHISLKLEEILNELKKQK